MAYEGIVAVRPPAVIRIDGMRLGSLNRSGYGMSPGAAHARAKEVKAIRACARERVQLARFGISELPAAIHVVRVSAGTLDDDNLIGACKPLLDGVAEALGVNDRSFVIVGERPGIKVTHEQRSEGRGRFAVVVELRYAA